MHNETDIEEFTIINSSDFLSYGKEHLNIDVDDNSIVEAKDTFKNEQQKNTLINKLEDIKNHTKHEVARYFRDSEVDYRKVKQDPYYNNIKDDYSRIKQDSYYNDIEDVYEEYNLFNEKSLLDTRLNKLNKEINKMDSFFARKAIENEYEYESEVDKIEKLLKALRKK